MLFTNQRLNQVEHLLGVTFYTGVDVGVKQLEDKKYVLFCKKNIFETRTFLVGFYILKDI